MFVEALSYDDVLIKPAYSDIVTRSSIDLTQDFLDLELGYPLISANMDYVTGYKMARAMWGNAALGILNRFYDWDDQKDDVLTLEAEFIPTFISVGTRDLNESLKHIDEVALALHGVCIDVAHGHSASVKELVETTKRNWPHLKVIAGNVATGDGAWFLADAGADAIKVGIGPGSVCTTREVTGVGIPQLTAVIYCADTLMGYGTKIIADGGIKSSGDIVKALAAGADAVMVGSLFAGADECPGESRTAPDNSVWKPYNGQSIYGVNGHKYTPEGIEGWVRAKGPVEGIIRKLVGGIRSGMSYVGANNLKELREKAEFMRVSALSKIESGTRISESF